MTNPEGQVGPPEPILAPNLNLPQNDQKDLRTQIGHFQPLASGEDKFQKTFPSIQGKHSPLPRIQAWCIYGTIYHYAPIFLCNPMVMFSGPNYAIPIQVPKSITHFEGSFFSHSVLQSLAATRRPFENPNHLALQELGGSFLAGLFQG
ncbi:hypothetical protein O181_113505 [Austropuccinia psidii MF-1]|uniref:Uncharacterized protein n=1 Tax=Austropuccinia psidii MF-1 TaxID=1389203 RepID=A0A9Q3K6J3_9BASI|nr:hypothetical protein [Austropuccinia psidii MF-1]